MSKMGGVFLPSDRAVVWWNFLCALLVLFTALELPVRLAFPQKHSVGAEVGYIVLDWLLAVFFCSDCVKNFHVAFENIEGDLVIDKSLIARNYLMTWFTIDFVASVPWDLFIPATYRVAMDGEADAGTGIGMVTLLRLLKLSRLIRLARLKRLWREIGLAARAGATGTGLLVVFDRQFMSMMIYFVTFLMITHINGCLLMLISRLDNFHAESWVVRNGLISPCCNQAFSPASKELTEQYTLCFFEAMMIFLGDRSDAGRIWEYWWIFFSLIIGAYFYAQLLGSITTAIGQSEASEMEYRSKMEYVHTFAWNRPSATATASCLALDFVSPQRHILACLRVCLVARTQHDRPVPRVSSRSSHAEG